MANVSRRSLLRGLAAGSALAGLAACSVSKNGGVTTITLNVTDIKNYGQAGLNAVATVLSVAAIASAIGTPAVTAIEAGSAALSAALSAFSSAAGSTLTITYDNTNWKTRVDSILSDLETVAKDLAAGITGASTKITSAVLSNANTILSALNTVVSAFQAPLGSVAARSLEEQPMTTAQALNILGVAR